MLLTRKIIIVLTILIAQILWWLYSSIERVIIFKVWLRSRVRSDGKWYQNFTNVILWKLEDYTGVCEALYMNLSQQEPGSRAAKVFTYIFGTGNANV